MYPVCLSSVASAIAGAAWGGLAVALVVQKIRNREEVGMLRERDAVATIAVTDIQAARRFYEGKLGLREVPTPESGVLSFQSGKSTVLVYESQYAGTNKATAATWVVGDDVKGVAQALRAKGVSFERYDFPGGTWDGDVHVMGDVKAAWFKDPAGNVLAIVNG